MSHRLLSIGTAAAEPIEQNANEAELSAEEARRRGSDLVSNLLEAQAAPPGDKQSSASRFRRTSSLYHKPQVKQQNLATGATLSVQSLTSRNNSIFSAFGGKLLSV